MEQGEDKLLIEQCCKGDQTAFRTLVCRYQKKLFSVAFGMLHNREDALEVLQEAFLKAHRNLPRFQGNSSFYTWIYRILVNLCIDFLRREGRHQKVEFDPNQEQKTASSQVGWESVMAQYDCHPGEALKNRELREQLNSAIDCLSPNHKAIIILRELEGMSYEEIAETLQCSKGTVMSRLHHARANLRAHLQPYVGKGESVQSTKKPATPPSSRKRAKSG